MSKNSSIVAQAFARAGLLGNPSDGYHGKTISFAIADFRAVVELEPSEQLVIVPGSEDALSFGSIHQFHDTVVGQGYYGGVRLIKAAIKRFLDFCRAHEFELHDRNFQVSFSSNIPRQVGLAGSSAIVTAALRALSHWYDVEIPPHLLASLTLSAEAELGIPAGLQDRVIQAYQGTVFMDFSHKKMQRSFDLEFGDYQPLPPLATDRLYVAFASAAGQPTEVLHNDLRKRFNEGDPDVVTAMRQFAELAEQGKTAVVNQDLATLSVLIDQNFDLRQSICELHPQHVQMVNAARSLGASAKYCGSGGAIVGIMPAELEWGALQERMSSIDCHVFQPEIAEPQ